MRASSFNRSWNGVRWEPSVLKPEPAPASCINSSVQGSSRTYTHTQKLIQFICPAPSVLGLPIGYKVKWKHPAKQAHTFSPTLSPKPWMYNLTPGSLRASSPGVLAAGRVKEEKLATTSLEFEFHLKFPCGSSSTELSYFHSLVQSGKEHNVNKHWKTRAKSNDIITIVISTNQHITPTFSMQVFKFQRRNCKLSFLFPPCHQSVPESLPTG